MAQWSDATTPTKENTGNFERRPIVRLKLDKPKTTIRLVGNFLARYVYWVVTKEGKKLPLECLRFDRTTAKWTNEDDPVQEIPKEIFEPKPEFAYVCNVIDRSDGQIKLFDLKSTIFKSIVAFVSEGNPADPENGYDITIVKEKTGPLPQNVKYTVTASRKSSPLTEEEKKLELYDLERIYKRPTYDEQKKVLLENTTYFQTDDIFRPSEDEGASDLG